MKTVQGRVLVAGAGGVIGRRLTPLLQQRGYEVLGTTRSAARGEELRRAGVTPLVVDAYDRDAVAAAVLEARPQVIIHQMTDLSGGFAPDRQLDTLTRNARLRIEGTRNLVAAARVASVPLLIAQSIVWMFAAGHEPHGEDDPLDVAATGARGVTVQGVVELERAVLGAAPVRGVVLRYGWFYGPGASAQPGGTPGVHVDAAASAAVLAIERGGHGIYNVAEPSTYAATDKARRELGWDPDFRM